MIKTTHSPLLGILLCGFCVTVIQPTHAQVVEQERMPVSAKQLALQDQAVQLVKAAALALHTGNYAEAEDKARQAAAVDPLAGIPQEILAAALNGQGRDQEAIQVYRAMAVSGQPRHLLPYAQLLLKSGQWAQAVTVYNQVLLKLPDIGSHPERPVIQDGELMRANSHFSPDIPEPAALATALHLARGMIYNATPTWTGGSQDTEAMAEYQKALQSAPGNPLANYFYGRGWQKLSPADRGKFGTAQQAKSALQKASKIGSADVKAAAAKALENAG